MLHVNPSFILTRWRNAKLLRPSYLPMTRELDASFFIDFSRGQGMKNEESGGFLPKCNLKTAILPNNSVGIDIAATERVILIKK